MQIYYISTFYPLSQVSFLTIKPNFFFILGEKISQFMK